MDEKTLYIRPFQAGDALNIYQSVQESLGELPLWMPDLNADLTLKDIRTYIESQPQLQAERKAYNFAIIDLQGENFLGGCGLTQFNWQHRFANLYYWVRSSRTKQGIASAATRLLAHFGFETLNLHRIEIVMAVNNSASIRVAEKVGAKLEARLRNRIYLHGVVSDAFLYTLIPGDIM